MASFEGLTVLVSGATGGFGRATAFRLAEAGARLVLTDLDPDRLEALAAEIGGDCAVMAGDVSREALSRELVHLAAGRFGGLDIAINNAGIAQSYTRLHRLDTEEAERILAVDLLGVFFAMKYQLALMLRQFRRGGRRGAIVNVASIAGLSGAPNLSVYAAAKHGVVGLTRSAAAEYATRGIRVNAVCPAYARTEMAMELLRASPLGIEAAAEHLVRGVPMKRLGEIDEVVEAILFAASPANSFMTGQALAVDGGIGAI
jgi:NAD(P)-dependent dehydrogenase (short-subunit alcohol dehydrogenase family)